MTELGKGGVATGTRRRGGGGATKVGQRMNPRPTACGALDSVRRLGPRPWRLAIGGEATRRAGQPSRASIRTLLVTKTLGTLHVEGRTAVADSSPAEGRMTEALPPIAGRSMVIVPPRGKTHACESGLCR